jgi:hypothetical protein
LNLKGNLFFGLGKIPETMQGTGEKLPRVHDKTSPLGITIPTGSIMIQGTPEGISSPRGPRLEPDSPIPVLPHKVVSTKILSSGTVKTTALLFCGTTVLPDAIVPSGKPPASVITAAVGETARSRLAVRKRATLENVNMWDLIMKTPPEMRVERNLRGYAQLL